MDRVLWDFIVQTDHVIQARRPDKDMDHTWIIDIVVSGDNRTEERKCEKNDEISRSSKRNSEIVEHIIKCDTDCNWSTRGSGKSRWVYKKKRKVDRVQFSVLLGRARILRKVLDTSNYGALAKCQPYTSFRAKNKKLRQQLLLKILAKDRSKHKYVIERRIRREKKWKEKALHDRYFKLKEKSADLYKMDTWRKRLKD